MSERSERIEAKLREQLRKDHKKKSRLSGPDEHGVITCRPSGLAVGLAIALNDETGEGIDQILNRVGNE